MTLGKLSLTAPSAPQKCGVPQGSILGPILFPLYVLPSGDNFLKPYWVSFHFYGNYSQIYFPLKRNVCNELRNDNINSLFFSHKRGRQYKLCCLRCLSCAFFLNCSCCMTWNTWVNTSHASLVHGLPTLTSWGFQWKQHRGSWVMSPYT